MAIFFRIVPEYQRVVRFTFGRYDGNGGPRGPGWVWVIPFIHGRVTVDLREEVFERRAADLYHQGQRAGHRRHARLHARRRPEDSVLKVQSYRQAARGMAITTLRAVVGDMALDDVLAKREQINAIMQARMDEVTDRWGVKVNAVEIQRDRAAARNPGGDEPPDVGRA